MRILILRFSSMGDVLLVTALFSYLKQHVSDAEIVFLTNTLYADLFREDQRLQSVVPFSRKNDHAILSELAAQKWDRILDLQNNRRSRRYRKRYFPQVDAGVFRKFPVKRLLLIALHINVFRHNNSVAARYIQAFTGNRESIRDIPPISLDCDDASVYQKTCASESVDAALPTIALFPFSAWRNKQWRTASYATVGRYFLQKKWNVAIIGGPEDSTQASALQREIGGTTFSLAGKLNLYEIGCFLRHCMLALGNDTGLSHCARACGVRTGIIYGATTFHFGFFPFGDPPFKVFQSSQFCRPCHPHGGNVCWRLSRPCLKQISVEEVIKGLEDLYEEKVQATVT